MIYSLGNMKNEKTQIGYIVRLKDSKGNICALLWKSKVAKRISRSTLDAEALAMAEGLENGMWIQRIWEEIMGRKLELYGFMDSKNLEEAVKSFKKKLKTEKLEQKFLISRN